MASVEIDKNGIKTYREAWKGHRHREDGPAVIFPTGGYVWFKHGYRYNPNGPFAKTEDGLVYWRSCLENTYPNRTDNVAIDSPTGYKRWYDDGIVIWPELE